MAEDFGGVTMKHNPGELNRRITLRKPGPPVRDELGGIAETTYVYAGNFPAKVTQRNQSRQQFVGDYVTTDTRYFVVRDIRSLCPGLNSKWQLLYRDYVWNINKIELLDEEKPPYIQITATAVNTGGGII